MKIAILNFSGNVGKTTIARHLITPRIKGAQLISVETANADEGEADALRGKDFAQLQQYMATVDNLVVDIGASNIEDLIGLMKRYKGSHEDFDYFLMPVVPDLKQQKDTAKSAAKLAEMGVAPERIKIVFNRAEEGVALGKQYNALIGFLAVSPVANYSEKSVLTENEIYQLVKADGRSITLLANDKADYKGMIAKAKTQEDKLSNADKMAVQRLASGVLPELDACFEALQLV